MTEDGCDTLMVEGEVVMNGSSTNGVNDAKTTSPASSTVFFFLSWHSPLCSSFLCTATEQILQNISVLFAATSPQLLNFSALLANPVQ